MGDPSVARSLNVTANHTVLGNNDRVCPLELAIHVGEHLIRRNVSHALLPG
jgi:hypothetical protein